MRTGRILTVACMASMVAGGSAALAAGPAEGRNAPAPALEKDDIFAPYAKGVPKVTTVISGETKDGVKVTKLRFASAEGSKEGVVKACAIPESLGAFDWYGGITFTLKTGSFAQPMSLSTKIYRCGY